MLIRKNLFSLFVLGFFFNPVTAIELILVDSSNNYYDGAIVTFNSGNKTSSIYNEESFSAVMDQIEKQFSPQVLIVQRGTSVTFPNSDSIKHHVYSFSNAKSFELELYEGLNNRSIDFDKSGVIELGCNVHDWMLGFIYVIETPFYTTTNSKGAVDIDLPPGEYSINVWHPRFKLPPQEIFQSAFLSGDEKLVIRFDTPLYPPLKQHGISGTENY